MAIIRTRGGIDGIQLYLVDGKKSGRFFSRNELDERIVFGDLDLTNKIIQSIDRYRERYIHATISFKEDALRPETFEDILKDYKAFAFAAYREDEYNCYAEAHIPRIKSYVDENGEMVIRLPHIHIIIPRLNLLSAKDLNPFGLYMTNISFVNAFQEHVNSKYGTASPADNRRTEFSMESTILSRLKGDVFQGQNSEFKESILAQIIEKNITNYDAFKMFLREKGETKTRNHGKKINEYEAIKLLGEKKFINLRHLVFSKEFVELSTLQKLARIKVESKINYFAQKEAKPTSKMTKDVLADWSERRCKEIKYLNTGNTKQYKQYRDATTEDKHVLLANYESEFYEKFRNGYEESSELISPNEVLNDQVNNRINSDGFVRSPAAQVNPETGRAQDTFVAQLLRDKSEQIDARRAGIDPDYKEIKQYLSATRLLTSLSHSHGVILEKYQITEGKGAGDRIHCGNKNYNLSDFLTKELHLSWFRASVILKHVYEEQMNYRSAIPKRVKPEVVIWKEFQDHKKANYAKAVEEKRVRWEIQRESEKIRLSRIKASFYAEKSNIYADKRLSKAERRAALSLCTMNRVMSEATLRARKVKERTEIKREENLSQIEKYRQFLLFRAREGDEAALAELRRQRVVESQRYENEAAFSTYDGVVEPKAMPRAITLSGLSFEIDRNGTVTYSIKGKEILRDEGRVLKVLDADDDAVVEVAIRCAHAKFGNKLKITGSTKFREKVARLIACKNLNIEFDDQFTNSKIQKYRSKRITDFVDNQPASALPIASSSGIR